MPLSVAICFAIAAGGAAAQETAPPPKEEAAPTLEAIEVTAQKRTENLQKVPISIQVLGEAKLDELNVTDFEDYVKYLPSVSYQTFGPGFAQIYMRGVASGGDGNHSGSLPSVGVYLDEQPVTTIQGPLDLHIYDVERVESLAGPQGTLYGASAQSGALRIITNKPDPSAFAANAAVEVNSVRNGGFGFIQEGMVNIPMGERAAIRLVGWHETDSGYIDNEGGQRTFPTSGITVDNTDECVPVPGVLECTYAEEDAYNDVESTGGRVALKFNINDNWSITPTIMGQRETTDGVFFFDQEVGDLALTHFYPETSNDRWWQAALTVEGKIGNFDITYNYAHLNRHDEVESDYSDYSFWYDTLAGYGYYTCSDFDPNTFTCNNASFINPSQLIQGKDRYTKDSHELRIASPAENRFRFVAGVFWQDQFHDIEQRYFINGLSDNQEVSGWPDTLWLTKQERRDHDEAIYGEFTFDFTDRLAGTLGARHFRADNSLQGFFGFGPWGWVSSYGEIICPPGAPDFNGAPCETFDKEIKESGTLGKANLTFQITPTKMIYATWSEGYRPGGINRRGTLPPYLTDYLTNLEFGWKTTWMDNRLAFNGSVFRQTWKDFQFSILGANGLTEIKNANQARIDGLELDADWQATYNLRLSAGAAYYDAKLTENYCGATDAEGTPITDCPVGSVDFPDGPQAPEGTQLPVTPRFKGNATARYTWDIGKLEAHVQLATVYVGRRTSDLRLVERDILGGLDAYRTFDFSSGVRGDRWSLEFYVNNLLDERAEIARFTGCAESVCGASGVDPQYPDGQVYTVTNTPRQFGLRYSRDW